MLRLVWGLALVLPSLGCTLNGDVLDFSIDPDAPRCVQTAEDAIRCDHATVTFATGPFGASSREVHLMVPNGTAPPEGWPVALLFQGSFHGAEGFFEGAPGDAFGGYHQTRLVRALLDGGYAVLAPEARFDGAGFWDTNVLPFAFAWDTSEDHQLMVEILDAIDRGRLGALDPTQLYAAGISSGGYMASRVGVSYPGRFRGLAIQSASYATCSGFVCVVPDLPHDHPPTLFLHGGADLVVPPETSAGYAAALEAREIRVRRVVDVSAEHAWLESAPTEVLEFFGSLRAE